MTETAHLPKHLGYHGEIAMTAKLERDGMVAVLISKGFGAGWYTWNRSTDYSEAMLFDPEMADAILANDSAKTHEIALRKYPDAYSGGVSDLVVVWVEKNSRFIINEYDGNESLWLQNELNWITA